MEYDLNILVNGKQPQKITENIGLSEVRETNRAT
jgi:hypothetical protein